MITIAHRGHRLHAPENSQAALISGYVAGAGALEFGIQLTKDGHLLLASGPLTGDVTGQAGRIDDLTLAQLKEMDWSEKYVPRNSAGFQYYTLPARMLAPLTLTEAVEWLPENIEFLISLSGTAAPAARHEELVTKVVNLLELHGLAARVVLASDEPDVIGKIRALAPALRVVAAVPGLTAAQQLDFLRVNAADGLWTRLEAVFAGGQITPFGRQIEQATSDRQLRIGAIVSPARAPSVFTRAEYEGLRGAGFVWGIGSDSLLDVAAVVRAPIPVVEHDFPGVQLDRTRFAFGYAKANKYALVHQDNGVHVDIDPYDRPFPNPTDPLQRRLTRIESDVEHALRDWPFYSGGGVGYLPGIRGDFSARVDYTVQTMAQATTLEMAVLNVDPGAHVGTRPASVRQKDSFYDPHGAPPYVGVEHDENDGFRINWNLGVEYDNNQYGRPVGDGNTPRGATLRLDRRGAFFAAYYRDAIGPTGAALGPNDWVCTGVARNDSLNPVVYLRCAGKRWRQESEADTTQYMPVIPNKFTFKKLTITRFPT